MDYPLTFDTDFSFVDFHLTVQAAAPKPRPPWRAVTISRQTGCGADVIARKLAALLHQRGVERTLPWKVFDRDLMDKVLEDLHLPARLAQFLPEDRISAMQDIVDSLFNVCPDSHTVARQTTETILRLAELGNVVLIGRGSTVITAKLPDVFHVRLVAPLEKRIEHAHQFYNLDLAEARRFCLREDAGRKRYLKKYFGADVEDPLLYHLTVNTGMMSFDETAQAIARAMLEPSNNANNITALPAFTPFSASHPGRTG